MSGWSVVICANPAAEYDVNSMDFSLRTRMAHCVYQPTHPQATEEWVAWAAEEGLDPNFVQFLAANPDLLWEAAREEDWSQQLGFMLEPTPRGDERVGKLLKFCKDMDDVRLVISCNIGAAALGRYESFSPRFTLNDIIAGKEPPPDLSRMELLGLQPALASLGKPTRKLARNVYTFIEMVAGVRKGLESPSREIAVMMMKTLARCSAAWTYKQFIPESLSQFLRDIHTVE